MTITSHQIHNVLRTYGKQLRRGFRLQQIRKAENTRGPDQIRISSEAKRRQVVERVASEILLRLADPSVANGDMEKRIIDAVSQEYGQPVAPVFNEEEGMFNFDVLDADKKVIIKTETGRAAEDLQQRLVEVAKEIVDRTMI